MTLEQYLYQIKINNWIAPHHAWSASAFLNFACIQTSSWLHLTYNRAHILPIPRPHHINAALELYPNQTWIAPEICSSRATQRRYIKVYHVHLDRAKRWFFDPYLLFHPPLSLTISFPFSLSLTSSHTLFCSSYASSHTSLHVFSLLHAPFILLKKNFFTMSNTSSSHLLNLSLHNYVKEATLMKKVKIHVLKLLSII